MQGLLAGMLSIIIVDGVPGRFLLQGTGFAEPENYDWLSVDFQR